MWGRLLMMPSSSQVLDHQLIFHIIYGLGQFYHRQNKGEERRGRFSKKNNSCLTNIERKRCKKAEAASQTQRIGKVAKIGERRVAQGRSRGGQQVSNQCASVFAHRLCHRTKTRFEAKQTRRLWYLHQQLYRGREEAQQAPDSTSSTKDGESRHSKHQTAAERERPSMASTYLALC